MSNISKESNKLNVSEWKSPQLVDRDEREANLSRNEADIRQEVYDEAFKEGFDDGKEAGMQVAKDQLQIVHSLLAALNTPFNEQGQQLVETIAQLAGKIANAVVSRELRTDPEMFIAMVRETISALNTSQQEVFIHLNPSNATVIRELMGDESNGQGWKFIDDPSVSPDDCKVRCQDSVIDVKLDARIDLIIEQFLESDSNEPEL